MATNSRIEWTETTWNPVTGCSKISEGCRNCYAEVMAKRLQAMGQERYLNGFQVTTHEDLLDLPRTWKRPRVVFVNSMSDLFHKDVPEGFIQRVFAVMNETPEHTYQVLTKRPERVVEMAERLTWTENIWMGVSVENQQVSGRVDLLRKVPAKVRFLSCEPLLGELNLNLEGIHWVIAGGESGPKARPMHPDWVRSLRDQCQAKGVAFFFKQYGEYSPDVDETRGARILLDRSGKSWTRMTALAPEGAVWLQRKGKKKAGRLLDGRTWDEMPKVVEF